MADFFRSLRERQCECSQAFQKRIVIIEHLLVGHWHTVVRRGFVYGGLSGATVFVGHQSWRQWMLFSPLIKNSFFHLGVCRDHINLFGWG